MSYVDYKPYYGDTHNQHNIMALVGNGFDIQILKNLGIGPDTRYEAFYHYLRYQNFNEDNLLVRVMRQARDSEEEDWSDIESGIARLLSDGAEVSGIEESLDALQEQFSKFLDEIITPDVLAKLSSLVMKNESTTNSLCRFMRDVTDEDYYVRMSLVNRMDIGDIFNFRFINFNYTPLLDNFIHLDKKQFNPHPFRSSDRQINFEPNPYSFSHPIGLKGRKMVAYLNTDVTHPHGAQHTPRSILFGIDSECNGIGERLIKPYWAQNRVKQGPYFDETHLFIIFGCSLGESDQWWWHKIADTLEKRGPQMDNPNNLPPDLLIYWHKACPEDNVTREDVLLKFAKNAGRENDENFITLLNDRAYVVLFDDNSPREWLRLQD